MLAMKYAAENGVEIRYETIEKFPVSEDIIKQLDYPEQIGLNRSEFFNSLHEAPWGQVIQITDYFKLNKVAGDITLYEPTTPVDVLFFDAFAPDLQPALWSIDVFKRLYNAMAVGGILVTYSSKGFVKQNLRDAGFVVKRLPGPKGKRHMILAKK